MSNRVLAFIVCLPIAGAIGFAAGRVTATTGTLLRADAPSGGAHLRVDRPFTFGAERKELVLSAAGEEIALKTLDEQTGDATELIWAADGSIAGALVNGAKLVVVDVPATRIIYELPLLDVNDGSRAARGIGFSANAMAVTFDDCPRAGAGCRPRFIALPARQ